MGETDGPAHANAAFSEADRLMTICNACRYCEGLCAVFPALEMRRHFSDSDLNYLANLCHVCGACYHDCQFAPPHEFDVNVPRTLARVRAGSYRQYAWPTLFAGAFDRNGLTIALAASLGVAAFVVGVAVSRGGDVLFSQHVGAGTFYRLIPHGMLILLFGAAFLYAVAAIIFSVRNFWGDISGHTRPAPGSMWHALSDAARLRYLDGGGAGCAAGDSDVADRRRLYHHLTFYGFLLCFLSTSVATLYHYLLGREAPYAWYDLPVLLGTVGGIGLIAGPLGLFGEIRKRDPVLGDPDHSGMDNAFLLMLLLTGATGLALLLLRETVAMGVLLAIHLGLVFALFVTAPYGKFVHGLYRFAALLCYARERSQPAGPSPKGKRGNSS
jgi:citrate/tricarballylate utilization protein